MEPIFPSPGLRKEYLQVLARTDTRGQSDYEAKRTVLSQKENRYLVRQMCWVLKIEGLETYILKPRDVADFDVLINTIRVPPRGTDIDVVVGVRGPIASAEMCNGLMLPIVIFDQIYSFDIDTLIRAIPRPQKTDARKFSVTAEELFNTVVKIADNVGGTDEHRALNYLSMRNKDIYKHAALMNQHNFSMDSVEVRPSELSETRKVMDVVITFKKRDSGASAKSVIRVDVTEEFPYEVTELEQYVPVFI
ncbi:MAG: hypothetical protein GEU26_06505 [Nitrososphaeraceae archaeon]|nr:hypothetical protein [Nitrososphaeraceae archaeon]